MDTYHKIQTVFKRDPENKYKTLLDGKFATSEFEFLSHNRWYFTEKVDGTNIRIMFDGERIIFGGKTDQTQIPTYLSNRLNKIFLPQIDLFKDLFADGVCLYGEGYGAKIQKGGGNYCSDQNFVLFDVKIGNWWLQRDDVHDVASKLNLRIVPIIDCGSLLKMAAMTKRGFNSTWGSFQAEGIVARPDIELKTRSGDRIITKIKCKDFVR